MGKWDEAGGDDVFGKRGLFSRCNLFSALKCGPTGTAMLTCACAHTRKNKSMGNTTSLEHKS
jgi:hypothetical protein